MVYIIKYYVHVYKKEFSFSKQTDTKISFLLSEITEESGESDLNRLAPKFKKQRHDCGNYVDGVL